MATTIQFDRDELTKIIKDEIARRYSYHVASLEFDDTTLMVNVLLSEKPVPVTSSGSAT
jgi:hypothetical protein